MSAQPPQCETWFNPGDLVAHKSVSKDQCWFILKSDYSVKDRRVYKIGCHFKNIDNNEWDTLIINDVPHHNLYLLKSCPK